MVAKLMEFVNELMKLHETPIVNDAAWAEATRTLALMLAPSAPHIAEELWSRMGNEFSIHTQAWPAWDAALAADDVIEIPVQVNGKVCGHVSIPANASAEEAIAAGKAQENVAGYLDGEIVREIYVPTRLVNLVVK